MKLLSIIHPHPKPPTIADLKAIEAAFIIHTENLIAAERSGNHDKIQTNI